MPNRSSKPKRPKDPNQLAKLMVDIATGEAQDDLNFEGKNPAAVLLGRLGGKKGGAARAAKLSAKERSAIAAKAAHERWVRHKKDD